MYRYRNEAKVSHLEIKGGDHGALLNVRIQWNWILIKFSSLICI